MIYYDKKNQRSVYADGFEPDSPVILVECDGSRHTADFNAGRLPILAYKADLIDISGEIEIKGTAYRLDLEEQRIRHLTTQTKKGTAGTPAKNAKSWKLYKKYKSKVECAFAWQLLCITSPGWKDRKPVEAPPMQDVPEPDANSWACPECGTFNDPSDAECSKCGLVNDEPVVDDDLMKEAMTPEVVSQASAGDEYAERVAMLHTAAEQHASASVLCAAMAGAVMIQKKKAGKHGEFLPWLNKLILPDGRRIAVRTCQNYMKLAEQMATRIKALPNTQLDAYLIGQPKEAKITQKNSVSSIVSLLASIDPTKANDLRHEAIADALKEISDEQTLSQLYFDWGICKSNARAKRGGDVELQAWLAEHHPKLVGTRYEKLSVKIQQAFTEYLEDRKPSDDEVLEAQREEADRYWTQTFLDLNEFGGKEDPTWIKLDNQKLLQTMVLLDQMANEMKSVLKERGVR